MVALGDRAARLPRQVVTVHDVAFLDAPEYFSASFRLLYENLVPALMRRVAKVVTVSEFSRQRIIERTGIDADKIVVIGNGVGEQFRPPESRRRRPRAGGAATAAALSPGPGDRGSAQEPRAHAQRLASGSALAADDLWLVVSGSRERAHVFGDAGAPEASPRTLFVGYVAEENMAPLIGAAEAFLFPSLYEGFGIPILEAMACATPVLTSDATATREIAAKTRRCWSIRPMKLRLPAALSRWRTMRSEGELSAIGPAHAAKFTWDDVAARYRALFESLRIAGRSHGPA